MEQREGLVIAINKREVRLRTPGIERDCLLPLSEAPEGIERHKSVSFRVLPRPQLPTDRALEVKLMLKPTAA